MGEFTLHLQEMENLPLFENRSRQNDTLWNAAAPNEAKQPLWLIAQIKHSIKQGKNLQHSAELLIAMNHEVLLTNSRIKVESSTQMLTMTYHAFPAMLSPSVKTEVR